jgi:hypothetical protein
MRTETDIYMKYIIIVLPSLADSVHCDTPYCGGTAPQYVPPRDELQRRDIRNDINLMLVYFYNTHQVLVGLPQGVGGLAILFYFI